MIDASLIRVRLVSGRLSSRVGLSSRRIAAILAIATAVAVAVAAPVGAHPSDFNTLTIDLLISDESIVIDAAMVQATYEPFPTTEEKQIVAVGVLDALGLAGANVDIDADLSDRYHDVGFTISGLGSVTAALLLLGAGLAAVAVSGRHIDGRWFRLGA